MEPKRASLSLDGKGSSFGSPFTCEPTDSEYIVKIKQKFQEKIQKQINHIESLQKYREEFSKKASIISSSDPLASIGSFSLFEGNSHDSSISESETPLISSSPKEDICSLSKDAGEHALLVKITEKILRVDYGSISHELLTEVTQKLDFLNKRFRERQTILEPTKAEIRDLHESSMGKDSTTTSWEGHLAFQQAALNLLFIKLSNHLHPLVHQLKYFYFESSRLNNEINDLHKPKINCEKIELNLRYSTIENLKVRFSDLLNISLNLEPSVEKALQEIDKIAGDASKLKKGMFFGFVTSIGTQSKSVPKEHFQFIEYSILNALAIIPKLWDESHILLSRIQNDLIHTFYESNSELYIERLHYRSKLLLDHYANWYSEQDEASKEAGYESLNNLYCKLEKIIKQRDKITEQVNNDIDYLTTVEITKPKLIRQSFPLGKKHLISECEKKRNNLIVGIAAAWFDSNFLIQQLDLTFTHSKLYIESERANKLYVKFSHLNTKVKQLAISQIQNNDLIESSDIDPIKNDFTNIALAFNTLKERSLNLLAQVEKWLIDPYKELSVHFNSFKFNGFDNEKRAYRENLLQLIGEIKLEIEKIFSSVTKKKRIMQAMNWEIEYYLFFLAKLDIAPIKIKKFNHDVNKFNELVSKTELTKSSKKEVNKKLEVYGDSYQALKKDLVYYHDIGEYLNLNNWISMTPKKRNSLKMPDYSPIRGLVENSCDPQIKTLWQRQHYKAEELLKETKKTLADIKEKIKSSP